MEQTEVFALDEIGFLKGIMVLGILLSGCLHTSKIRTNNIKILWQEYLSQKRGFLRFLFKTIQRKRAVGPLSLLSQMIIT